MGNSELHFFLPMIPPTTTYQEHRAVPVKDRVLFFDTPELRAAREKFLSYLAPFAPPEPMVGALRLVTKWLFPITGNHNDGDWKATRPDTDNLIKLFKDCMTACHFWKDDAQVASEITEKFYAEHPGIFVQVSRIEVRLDE